MACTDPGRAEQAQLIHDRVLLLRSAAEQPARSAIEDDYLLAQWAHDAEKEAVIQLRAEQAARETTEKATRDRFVPRTQGLPWLP